MSKAVLVTDGDQRAALAIVRSLGAAGVPVTVGEARTRSLAGSSRYCTEQLLYPSPLTDPDAFLAWLEREVSGKDYDVLLPVTDVTVQLVSAATQVLAPHVRIPIPDGEKLRQVQDKGRLLELAAEAGIDHPRTLVPSERTPVEEIAREMSYPAVIKPRASKFLNNGRWVSGVVEYATSAEELVSKYQRMARKIPDPLIQERIEGEGRGVFLLIWEGELLAAFCHRRLREKPPWGGVSVYCEGIQPDADLIDRSVGLLKGIGWQGVAMLEFKIDRRDLRPKLIELNGRFWGSLQLAIDSGVNFPLLLYRAAHGEQIKPDWTYRIGVKNRWLLGDLDQLWITLKQAPANGPPRHRVSRLRACSEFLRFWERNLRYDVQRWEDRGPGWFECKDYLHNIFHRPSGRREHSDAR